MPEYRPDGLTVVITKLCRYGQPGDIKTISYSAADQLCIRGYAQRWPAPVPVEQIPPTLPKELLPEDQIPKVTAVCPTYNRKKYLLRVIACFLSQTYKNSELLIVDDGEESVADCIPVNSRIRHIRLHCGRMKQGEKRNICCEFATGKIIVHFDDDDWSSPTRIEDQVKKLEASKKQLLSYHNILYWNEDTKKVYRCWPNNIRGPHGATFCYYKSFWEQNKFTDDIGEDTRFGFAAMRAGKMIYADAKEQMVICAHAASEGASGNVSQTANSMGTLSIPEANVNEIPSAFFRESQVVAPHKTAMDDVVMAVVQGLDWPVLQSYANSLVRTGFQGTKLLLAANITALARTKLLQLGFKIVDIPLTDRTHFITHSRFAAAISFLQQHCNEFRYALWADTRDLIFQENPSPWLEQNLAPARLLGASECWQIKNQPMNDKWIRETCSNDYTWLREEVACCGGTLAGDADAVYDALCAIYKIVAASPRANDQAALNYILRVSPLKEITRIPAMREGFCATVGAFNTGDFKSYSAGPPLTDAAPIFDVNSASVLAPGSKDPFIIFHQYDRDDRWKLPIARKFQ